MIVIEDRGEPVLLVLLVASGNKWIGMEPWWSAYWINPSGEQWGRRYFSVLCVLTGQARTKAYWCKPPGLEYVFTCLNSSLNATHTRRHADIYTNRQTDTHTHSRQTVNHWITVRAHHQYKQCDNEVSIYEISEKPASRETEMRWN